MTAKRSGLRKGPGLFGIIVLVMTVTLAIGWVGMRYPDTLSALRRGLANYQLLWLVWRLSLYMLLAWGSRKVWRRVRHQAATRAMLIRMMGSSLLFILLGEYALLTSQGRV
ncbi:hypothetical protein ID850_17165 [Xenorhabdus sp. Flor]|nr:hypothetical protein [Xenorhabdus sp. Flor]